MSREGEAQRASLKKNYLLTFREGGREEWEGGEEREGGKDSEKGRERNICCSLIYASIG